MLLLPAEMMGGTVASLTLQQCGLWHASADRSGAHRRQYDFRISGLVEVGRLRDVIASLVMQCELLRTSYEVLEGRCEGRVVPFRKEAVVIDEPQRLRAIEATCQEGSQLPFQAIIRPIDECSCAVSIFAHPLVLDESSLLLMWEEILERLHRPAGAGDDARPATGSYQEYEAWQRNFLDMVTERGQVPNGLFVRHMRYWQRRLNSCVDRAHVHAGAAHSCGSTASFDFDELDFAHVLRRADASRVTPEAILHAAVAQSLADNLGCSQAWICGYMSGRFEPAFEKTLGVFEIPALFQYDVGNPGSFDDLVQRVFAEQIDVHKRPHVSANYLANRLLKATLPDVADARVTLREKVLVASSRGIRVSAENHIASPEGFRLDFDFRMGAAVGDGMPLSMRLRYCPVCVGEEMATALVRGVHALLSSHFTATVAGKGNARNARIAVECCRWKMNGQLYKGRHLTPHDPTQRILARIWESVLRCLPIGAWDTLAEFAPAPSTRAELLDRIYRATGHSLPPDREDWTIEQQANYLMSLLPRALVTLLREGEAGSPPLFFAHGDFGGGGFYARAVLSGLGTCGAIYLLAPHGLNGLDIPDTIEQMARDFVAEIVRICPEGPVMLGGHCNGSLIAFEIARTLAASGRNVTFLAAVYPLHPWTDDMAESVAAAGSMSVRHANMSPALQALRRPSALRFERYAQAIARYRPPRAGVRATLFLPVSEVERKSIVLSAWRQVAERVEVAMVPGDHLSCITTYAADLGSSLDHFIDQLQRTSLRVGPGTVVRKASKDMRKIHSKPKTWQSPRRGGRHAR